MFAGRVGSVAHVARLRAVDRRDVDDRAAAVGQHGRNLVLHAQPHALQVHTHDFVPLCLGDVRHLGEPRTRDARIVDRAVEAAEFLDRGLDHVFDIRGAADIGLDEMRLAACIDDSLHDLGALLGASGGDDDLGALLREFQRGGFSQPGTSAGHQCDLACKILHVCLPRPSACRSGAESAITSTRAAIPSR